MIPKKPATAPTAHIHMGTRAKVSSTFHTDSGTEPAESMVGYSSIGVEGRQPLEASDNGKYKAL